MTTIRGKIGHIIAEGGTTYDIQKVIPGFSSNPTIEFFKLLGYADSTAKKYLSKLQKNNIAEKNMLISEGFLFSKNADLSNLIVDTSVIAHDCCFNIIDKASHVTILYQTVEEMDNVKRKKDINFSAKILEFTRYALKNSDRFAIARFSTNSKEYVDDAIIDFLTNLPIHLRPTLITADANLCMKAMGSQIEYIYYSKPSAKSTTFTVASKKDSKKYLKNTVSIGYGLALKKREKKYYILSDGSFSYQLISGKKTYNFLLGVETETPVTSNDKVKVLDETEHIFQIKQFIKKIK